MHLGGMVVLATAAGPAWARLGLGLVVAVSGLIQFRRLWLGRGRHAVTELEWAAREGWAVRFAGNANWIPADLVAAYVQAWLVVLVMKTSGRRRFGIVLTPDAVNPDTLRRLRVRLRLGSPAPA
jgi:hypothetical protein